MRPQLTEDLNGYMPASPSSDLRLSTTMIGRLGFSDKSMRPHYTHHNSKFRFLWKQIGVVFESYSIANPRNTSVLLWVGSIATSKYDPNLLPEKTKFRIAMGINE